MTVKGHSVSTRKEAIDCGAIRTGGDVGMPAEGLGTVAVGGVWAIVEGLFLSDGSAVVLSVVGKTKFR